jgi:prepilin-type processing-associated H-X9-DG protein
MNCWMNPLGPPQWNKDESWDSTKGYSGMTYLKEFRKQSDCALHKGGASMLFVTIDENPNTINDGFFVVDPNQLSQWVDAPATYHNNAGGLGFADGHAEIKKWHDQNVITTKTTDFPAQPGYLNDLQWMQQRATFRGQ